MSTPAAASNTAGMHHLARESAVAPSSLGRTLIFAFTLFTSASLVFVIEPMFGKMVLPRLGGTPAVWNTCMVFYQAILLGGYAYAHVLSRRFSLPAQVGTHAALLVVAAVMPVGLSADWIPPVDRSPIGSLVSQLARGVGFPLLMLCATAPLLQNWFSKGRDGASRDPYFLYAASNIGSILALLAYPLLIEPSSTLTLQRAYWGYGYIALAALIIGCGGIAWTSERGLPRASADVTATPEAPGLAHAPAPSWRRRARWVALALVPSSLMLGTTTYLSTDVASAPLLWTIPLAIYLLSFVVGFSQRRPLASGAAWRAAAAVLVIVVFLLSIDGSLPTLPQIAMHLTVLFLLTVALHSTLADDRPSTTYLTEFYLWIAVGGVAGGLFNSLLAPLLFNSVTEYPLALILGALLVRNKAGNAVRWQGLVAAVIAGVLTPLVVYMSRTQGLPPLVLALPLMAFSLAYIYSSRSRFGVGLALACVFIGGALAKPGTGNLIYARRSFFGVLRVFEAKKEHQHRLMHGTTLHGVESTQADLEAEPTTYYHAAGPVGQVFTKYKERLSNGRIGVVGLGAGTLSAYAQPGQQWTFYEVDPEVVRIANDTRYFHYLAACGARCRTELGDARLSLARAGSGTFDVLVLDAFSSDAIPVHLMTREAMALYLERLRPGGILVFHISNRHLTLRPLVAALAAEHELAGRVQFSSQRTNDFRQTPSEWVVLAKHESDLAPIAGDRRWERLPRTGNPPAWTDDFSNILSVLKLSS
jgi:spermidine synthase